MISKCSALGVFPLARQIAIDLRFQLRDLIDVGFRAYGEVAWICDVSAKGCQRMLDEGQLFLNLREFLVIADPLPLQLLTQSDRIIRWAFCHELVRPILGVIAVRAHPAFRGGDEDAFAIQVFVSLLLAQVNGWQPPPCCRRLRAAT